MKQEFLQEREVKKKADKPVRPNPSRAVTHDFLLAVTGVLFYLEEDNRKAIEQPFAPVWRKFWKGQAKSLNQEKPGRWEQFLERDGLTFLKKLADKKADPNFILTLFIGYMWRGDVNEYEHRGFWVQNRLKLLEAIELIRRNVAWIENRKRAIPVYRGLGEMETNIKDYLSAKDYRDPSRKGQPAKDKFNRVIFAIYEHLKQRTGGPQWQVFLSLLIAAGAISTGIMKRKGHENVVTDSSDRRISPHIKLFQKDHPKETSQILNLIKDWPPMFPPIP